MESRFRDVYRNRESGFALLRYGQEDACFDGVICKAALVQILLGMDSMEIDETLRGCTERHGRKILQHLQKQLGGKFCNVVLVSRDGQKFCCHKGVLAANSHVLEGKLIKCSKPDKCQIQLDINGDILAELVNYFYSGVAHIEESNCIELLAASASLGVASLEDELKVYIGNIARSNTNDFFKSDLFFRLPPDIMDETLSNVLISVIAGRRERVLEVIKALAKWASADHIARFGRVLT